MKQKMTSMALNVLISLWKEKIPVYNGLGFLIGNSILLTTIVRDELSLFSKVLRISKFFDFLYAFERELLAVF